MSGSAVTPLSDPNNARRDTYDGKKMPREWEEVVGQIVQYVRQRPRTEGRARDELVLQRAHNLIR